jgi:ABC-type multidrug transport system ATPase subunit
VGPNGAGKSTLFGLLLGFLKATSGTIRMAGLEPRDYTRRQGTGYLPERFRLAPRWPVRTALHAFASLTAREGTAALVDRALTRFGLEEHADKTVGALSRGLLQRLGLAQALLGNPELFVLDEPTEGLDPIWRLHFRELISELKNSDPPPTILMASHDLNEIERLVQHVVLLDAGAVRDSFDITQATTGERRYRIALQAPLSELQTVFPAVHLVENQRVFTVTVLDAHDLSTRLAALLALGAVVESVQPADGLEERVRAALEPERRS